MNNNLIMTYTSVQVSPRRSLAGKYSVIRELGEVRLLKSDHD